MLVNNLCKLPLKMFKNSKYLQWAVFIFYHLLNNVQWMEFRLNLELGSCSSTLQPSRCVLTPTIDRSGIQRMKRGLPAHYTTWLPVIDFMLFKAMKSTWKSLGNNVSRFNRKKNWQKSKSKALRALLESFSLQTFLHALIFNCDTCSIQFPA